MTISGRDVFGWRAAILCALLWGLAVTLADTLSQPVGELSAWEWMTFTSSLLWQWCVTGFIWVFGAKYATGRGAWIKIMVLLPVATAVALAAEILSPMTAAATTIRQDLGDRIPVTDLAAYLLWMNAFFGGIYVTGYLVTRRAADRQHKLKTYRLARSEADTLMREARVSAFLGQLQPAMLLAALNDLRERYESDRAAGDALFDRLVGFLRAAMPSVRGGSSTLAAELETVKAYDLLRASLATRGARWRFALGDIPPSVPFPSLVLLPALDAISSALADDAVMTLSLKRTADETVTLRLEADRPAALSEVIDQRLRAGLALTLGHAAFMKAGRDLPVEISLPAPFADGQANIVTLRSTGGNGHANRNDGNAGPRPSTAVRR